MVDLKRDLVSSGLKDLLFSCEREIRFCLTPDAMFVYVDCNDICCAIGRTRGLKKVQNLVDFVENVDDL